MDEKRGDGEIGKGIGAQRIIAGVRAAQADEANLIGPDRRAVRDREGRTVEYPIKNQ